MYVKLKDVGIKDKRFRVELVKSNIENINDWDVCAESAISGKAIIRMAELDSKQVFYNPYGLGKHIYDFDVVEDIEVFIKNNKNKTFRDANDYFILMYADIEIDEKTNKIAETSDNSRIIDRIIKIVLENIIT